MAQLSESWQPRQLLQSFCSQASSVSVLHLRRQSSAAASEVTDPVQVLLSLHGDSLCCSLLPASAAAVAAADATPAPTKGGTPFEGPAGGPLPDYLQRSFWGPLKLTDEVIDEGVVAFAACEQKEVRRDQSTQRQGDSNGQAEGNAGLVLMCGVSGLMRLMLLRLQQQEEPQQRQQQQQDPALEIVEQRLGGSNHTSTNTNKPWAYLQQLQKWKGTSSVARVATISNPLPFLPSSSSATTTAEVAAASAVRLAAVGCVGGELEVLLLQQSGALRCCSLKLPAAITSLKFHPSRALLAVGTAEGLLRVYDLSYAAAAVAAGAAPVAAEYLPCISQKDHLNSITALAFVPDAAAGALRRQQHQHKTNLAARRKTAATGVGETQFADALMSAASDSLVNVWDLCELPSTAGLLQQQHQELDLQQALQQTKKSALQLQKRLQQHQQNQQQQQLLLQLPTLEVVTSLLVEGEDDAADAMAAGGPFLLTGGAKGVVKLWTLREKKVLRVFRPATTVAAGSAAQENSDEDLGNFIRSLLLLPASSSSSGSGSRLKGRTLLVAQDSGLISLISPFKGLAALTISETSGEVEKAHETNKISKIRGVPDPEVVCLVGRLEGVFACRFIPEPPEACTCSCCETRRTGYLSSYPCSLLVLAGDPCAWYIDLGSGGLGYKPLGSKSLGFEPVGQQKGEGHQAAISCCDVSKNGCWVVTGGRDGSLCVWHRASDRLIAKLDDAHAGCLTAVAFQRKNWANPSALLKTDPSRECRCDCRGISPAHPHHLLFASCCDQNSVKLWRFAIPPSLFLTEETQQKTGSKRKKGSKTKAAFGQTQVSTEIECLASVVAHTKEINDLKFAPNDSLIATASQDKSCRLLTVPSLATKGELRGHRRGVHDIQFATREQTAATASGDACIKLWNLQTMACIKTLQGDGFGFLCLRFLSLDSQLLSFNSNGEAQLWNCRTAECAATMQPLHTDKVWCFDLWGEAMASAGADGRICIWRDATAETKAAKKLLALREHQELAAAQTLEATGKTEEVVRLLLRLRKKYALAAFIQRRLLGSLSLSLDSRDPAALLRKGNVAALMKLLPQQQEVLLQHLPPQQQQQAMQQQEEEDWAGIISRLSDQETKTLFGFVAEWTAGDLTMATAANGLLYLLLRRCHQKVFFRDAQTNGPSDGDREAEDDLFSYRGNATVGGKPAEEVLKALVLNSQRHERRAIGLLQKSYLLDLLLPGAAAVQQELQQLLLPLQQSTVKGEARAEDREGVKKKRKIQQQEAEQQQKQQEFALNPEIFHPHFGSDFTQRCLYGDE